MMLCCVITLSCIAENKIIIRKLIMSSFLFHCWKLLFKHKMNEDLLKRILTLKLHLSSQPMSEVVRINPVSRERAFQYAARNRLSHLQELLLVFLNEIGVTHHYRDFHFISTIMHDQQGVLQRLVAYESSVLNGLFHKTGLTPSTEEKFISLYKILHRPNYKVLFHRHNERGNFKTLKGDPLEIQHPKFEDSHRFD